MPSLLSSHDGCLLSLMFHRTESFVARYCRLWSGLYLLLVSSLVMAALYTLSVSFWRGPWRDMWEALPFVEKAMTGQANLADYWEQYGYSHRPLLSRLCWVADFRWFAGSNHLLLAVSIIMQCLSFACVRAVLWRDPSFTAGQRRILLAGVLFCLLNITQVFNFLHTFDVQWFLVTGFVMLSLERLLAGAAQQRTSLLVVAWCCVLVASLNNFSALVIWPVELLLLLALRYRWPQVAGFSVATVLYLMLYFHELPTGGDSLAGEIARQAPAQLLQSLFALFVVFPLWYLSNPLSFQLGGDGPLQLPAAFHWLAPSLMALLLLGAGVCWLQGLSGRRRFTPLAWLGLSLVLYGLGVGMVTAIGRALFWENVYALRYQNIVLLFWIGIVLWLAAGLRYRHVGLLAGAVLLLTVFGWHAGWYHDLILKTGNRTRDAHLALVVGLEKELSAIQATVSRSHLGQGSDYTLTHEAAFLRAIHAGPYADPAWQVPPLATLLPAGECEQRATVSLHGGNRYARLGIRFDKPTDYRLIAWFDGGQLTGLLIASRADTLAERLWQSVHGFTVYAGFARHLPVDSPDAVYARDGAGWCRLSLTREE